MPEFRDLIVVMGLGVSVILGITASVILPRRVLRSRREGDARTACRPKG